MRDSEGVYSLGLFEATSLPIRTHRERGTFGERVQGTLMRLVLVRTPSLVEANESAWECDRKKNGGLQTEKKTISSELIIIMLNRGLNSEHTTFSFSSEELKGVAETLAVLVGDTSCRGDLPNQPLRPPGRGINALQIHADFTYS